MAAALARMEAYLSSLPKGIDSFADHEHKAAFPRQFIEDHPHLLASAARLPPLLESMVREPPPVSAWIPEAHACALYLAATDLIFDGDDALLDAVYHMNVRVLRGPLYRVMMMMASPGMIVRASGSRWAAFHRGVKLKAEMTGASECSVRMIFPTNLFPELMASAYSQAFRAAVEAAGGKQVRFQLLSYSSTVAQFKGTWL